MLKKANGHRPGISLPLDFFISPCPTANIILPLQLVFSAPRPRLRLDLTKKRAEKGGGGRTTQWTVLCVAVAMMSVCVLLVGTMLSITSEYQVDR